MPTYIERQVNPPSKNKEKPQMFPRITDSEIVSEQQLAGLMASHGTLSRGNAKAALNDMAEVTAKLQGEKSARRMKRVTRYLDDVFHQRMVITHCKNLCKGDFLIDDRGKNGTSEFEGEWIQFGNDEFPNWQNVVKYLLRHK